MRKRHVKRKQGRDTRLDIFDSFVYLYIYTYKYLLNHYTDHFKNSYFLISHIEL